VVASGGAPSGGAGTGGSSSGGGSSGGASTGGTSSGGASSGGSGTGGGASGGSPGSGGEGGFEPCPATGPCRILPLGDSITDGLIGGGSGTNGGYRVPLFSMALADSKDITFVGTRMNGPDTVDGQPFPKNHEGESGIKITPLASKTFLFDGDPNIVLLHIGTNDLFQNEANGAPERLEAFIDDILAEMPDGLLVVAQLIPLPARESDLSTYNTAVAALVEEKAEAGAHILLADQYTGFPEDSELPDGIHPNAAGYERMAGVWYELIEPYLP
jgi:lysophospholipase L1-like esterase